ncbi:MAG: HEAT repeat domain-containing protein [Gemmatimonadetes bacterium]|nr:HEAT repeat domain-containing protein [Gemmatimonadota bacterium]
MASSTAAEAPALRTLLQSWEKGLRTLSMYPPNNPIHQQTIEAFREGLSELWEQVPDLEMTVTEAGLHWESELVLPVEEKSQSLAWSLFRDGIRRIRFSPGVEEEEIVTFLGLVHTARTLTDEDEDDLPTLLWAADLQFVHYRVAHVEDRSGEPIEGTAAGDWPLRPTAEQVQESIKEDTADEGEGENGAGPGPNAVVDLAEFESTLYFLDQPEIDYLAEEVRREYEQNLNKNVLSMLFDIFEAQPVEDTREEIITILGDLLPTLLGSGDFHSVAHLIRELRVVLGRTEMITKHRRLLAGLTITFSNPVAVEQLLEALELATIQPSPEEAEELFAHLAPTVLSTVLKWCGRFSNKEIAQALEVAIVRMAHERPHDVGVALKSSERVVVLEALRLVAERGLEGLENQLGHLIGHTDVAVRKALVGALVAAPTAQTMKALVRLLEDADSDVRTAAVSALAQIRFVAALPVIEEVVLGKKIRSRDLTERKAFFKAYGIIAGESSVSHLKGILLSKKFWRSEDSDTRACAAAALGHVEGESARVALAKATKDRDPVVRSAAMRALRAEPSQ